jgi:hypothetical protein
MKNPTNKNHFSPTFANQNWTSEEEWKVGITVIITFARIDNVL